MSPALTIPGYMMTPPCLYISCNTKRFILGANGITNTFGQKVHRFTDTFGQHANSPICRSWEQLF